ncbi:MAG: transposase [Phycisphaeraceae bacterium]
MVRGYHLILSAYGFWLPNDPRGSWSTFVREWELARYGKATKVNHRRSVAYQPHDVAQRYAAKQALRRPPVRFNGQQARAITRGFAERADRSGYVVHACAIMPDHAHLVIARHRYHAEQIANLLKGASTRRLIEENLHPFADEAHRDRRCPSPWARKHWQCFLSSHHEMERAIRYVQQNPRKEGMRAQQWKFVQPYTR